MENILSTIRPNLEKILLFAVFVFLLAAAIAFNRPSFFIITALLFGVFFFFKKQLWLALVLALPALPLGNVLSIELRPFWNYELSIAEALLLLALAVFLLDRFLSIRTAEIRFDAVAFFLLLYFALAAGSIWQAVDFKYYLFGLKAIFFSFAGYLLALNLIDSKRKIRTMLYSAAVALLILSIQIFYKFYQLGFSEKLFFERKLIILPLGPLATIVSIIAFLLPVVLAFFLHEDDLKNKAVIFPIFCFGAFALFVSLGKAAILAFVVSMSYLLFKIKKTRGFFLLVLVLAAMAGALLFTPLAAGLLTRIRTTFVDVNTRFRLLEYQTAAALIKDHLLFGVGSGQQLYYFKKMMNLDTSELVNNFFLQALIDFGLLGLLCAAMVLFSLWQKTVRIVRGADPKQTLLYAGLAAALLGSLVTGVLEVTFFALPFAVVFWLTVGTLMNLKYYE